MRLKGFFWGLTIVLTAVCLYQLSFTWVANSVEKKATIQAELKVKSLKKKALTKTKGDLNEFNLPIGKGILENGDTLDLTIAENLDIAKAYYINAKLLEKADEKVYPLIGSTFSEVKKRSLAFGLDLVGGMSVTLEVSVPDFIKSLAKNPKKRAFIDVYDAAKVEFDANSTSDFISIFINQSKLKNNKISLSDLFENDNLENNASDANVEQYLRDQLAKSLEQIGNVMKNRVNQFGVSEPNIQNDPKNNRLYIELPGVLDENTVAEKLQSTANLEFYELYNLDDKDGVLKESWYKAIEISNNQSSSPNTKSSQTKANNISSYFEPISENNPNFILIDKKNKDVVNMLLSRKDILGVFPSDIKFLWSSKPEKNRTKVKGKKESYYLYPCKVHESGKALVNGRHIQPGSASTEYKQENKLYTVTLKMTEEGADLWGDMTEANIGKSIAITMDNLVFSAPLVNEKITSSTEISGDFDATEAEELKQLLNAGSLDAPCIIKEQTKVGPTIGAENTRAGLISFVVALLVVFIYMYLYYGKAGIVADISLLLNIIFIFGTLASFGAVLTLAGIAGIVLTIGMAVDANVLVYERIREEQAKGKDISSAIDVGFKKALSSIIDANVTTLLTAIVLKIFGSGPIESFATTLIIGIFSSVFAALIISRLIFIWMLNKGYGISFGTKLTQNAFKNININFVSKRNIYYMISGLLVAGSIYAVATIGLKQSVEFSGGRTFSVKFEKPADKNIEFIKNNLSSVMKGASIEVKTKSSNYYIEINTNYLLSKQNSKSEVEKEIKNGLNLCKSKLGSYQLEPDSRFVSSSVSNELISSSTIAIVISLIMIFAYILLRFGTWQYSLSAIIALFHDVMIVLGVFAVFNGILPFNMDVDQSFIAAILTVIGYSINDTVVVFDRIREELSWKKDADYKTEINGALNSTLSRTINTSLTTIIVLVIIFLFGGSAIQGFVFALLVGIVVGTYSSLLIATPMLIDLTKKLKN